MANTFNPFGFTQLSGSGSTPSFDMVRLAIKNGSTTPVFSGDPIIQATGTTGLGTGYITQAAAPQAVSILSGVLANGVLTLTFTAIPTAPPVGGVIVVYGGTTSGTANGPYTILASSTTTVAVAFPGVYTTGTASGYIFTPLAGVFVGCAYQSVSQKMVVRSPYWPGTSDAIGDIAAFVVNDPNARFNVTTNNSNTTATAVGFASVGQNIGINFQPSGGSLLNGNTANGQSTLFADQYTLAATFPTGYTGQAYMPFRVVGLQNSGVAGATSPFAGINGWDAGTAFNNIVVAFNNLMSNQLSGV